MYRATLPAMLVALTTCQAHAYEFRVRFVERVGGADVELVGGNTVAGFGERRIRVQFGVFDDADGPAPDGGYLGWNFGTMLVTGAAANSNEYRNSSAGQHNGVGRLSPFNFAPAAGGANGLPAGDPFESLAAIDNTLGIQSMMWGFGDPPPQPVIRGRNTWVSTFEFSIDPILGHSYTIELGGNLVSALGWAPVGDFCEPKDPDNPVSITYAPLADEPREFSATLNVLPIPSPATLPLAWVAGIAALSRRRPASRLADPTSLS